MRRLVQRRHSVATLAAVSAVGSGTVSGLQRPGPQPWPMGSRRPHRAAPDTAGPCAVAIPCWPIRQAIRTWALECCGLLSCLADREQADEAVEGAGVAGEAYSP